ncbi:flagellar export chaperone FliS [Teredinibacter haidensis]|uniref:flagellar export chaperone FliS n=1 Tax=Teredinibacter haidensis TaxID=2731755 RepID=UPI000948B479|nr:flagellar export chaperone FliS [Teredinibacter haidensis]
MSVAPTQAAKIMEDNAENMSSHRVISLLLAGAMERVAQAKACLRDGNDKDKNILMCKLIGIINGLRQALDLESGGDIAGNLNTLYGYMAEKLATCSNSEEMAALSEVGKLIDNVRDGWDSIEQETQNCA